jgi:transposase
LVIEKVRDEGERILIQARTEDGPAPCPDCGTVSARVHAFCVRTVADVAVDARAVALVVRVRRLRCRNTACGRRTFREQVPGVLERHRCRTLRLVAQIGAVVRELAGRASGRVLRALSIEVSRHTAVRMLLRLPLGPRPTPVVLGVDDFALRRGHRYATVLIDALTRGRIDVLPDRKADTVQAWLLAHPGTEVVCRDGSAAYAQAITNALPEVVQVSDRWHLWHGFGELALKEVAAHDRCWAKGGSQSTATKQAQNTLERWHAVHDLLDAGVGFLDRSRRLQLSLNTVKRYARATGPDQLRPVPQYRTTIVDPYRDHLRQLREADPAVSMPQLFEEIKTLGYTGSLNLLARYVNQGRVESGRRPISPRRLTALILTDPGHLRPEQRDLVDNLTGACPEMKALAGHARAFARLLRPEPGNAERLEEWVTDVRADDLPHLHSFTRGLDKDRDAVTAAFTLPFHNGRTEGVNTKTKLLKRQMYGRAGFALLRHRILLG